MNSEHWRNDPVTKKQREFLRWWGVKLPPKATKGIASDLISEIRESDEWTLEKEEAWDEYLEEKYERRYTREYIEPLVDEGREDNRESGCGKGCFTILLIIGVCIILIMIYGE